MPLRWTRRGGPASWRRWPTRAARLRGCLTRIHADTGEGVEAILFRSDPAWVDAYAQHFGAINVFHNKLASHRHSGPDLLVTTEENCLERDDYLTSEYYNDFMRPQDVERALSGGRHADGPAHRTPASG